MTGAMVKLLLFAFVSLSVMVGRASPLSGEEISAVAQAMNEEMLGWQELVIAGMPLERSEMSELLVELKKSGNKYSGRALVELHEKLGQVPEALEALDSTVADVQPWKRELWRCKLLYELGRQQDAEVSLGKAHTQLLETRGANATPDVFVAFSRMAFALGKLDAHQAWLRWVATREAVPHMQWQAVKELVDISYHGSVPFDSAGLPRWTAPCLLLNEGKPTEAYAALEAGKLDWGKDLRVGEMALLAELFPYSADFTRGLIDRLSRAGDEERRIILSAVLRSERGGNMVAREFLSNRQLYGTCLPTIADLNDCQCVRIQSLAEVALEEAEAHPEDLMRVAFACETSKGGKGLDSQLLLRAWAAVDPGKLEAVGIPLGDFPQGLDAGVRLACILADFSESAEGLRKLMDTHPKAEGFSKGVVRDLANRIQYQREFMVMAPWEKPNDEMRRKTDYWRVLEDFCAPDIARCRPVSSDVLVDMNYKHGRRWAAQQDIDWLWSMPGPLRVCGPVDSRYRARNEQALSLQKTLSARVAPASPLANQLFLSEVLIQVRSESGAVRKAEEFVPAAVYPVRTRNLIFLQCYELFPRAPQSAGEIVNDIVEAQPEIAKRLHSIMGGSRVFGYSSPVHDILATASRKMADQESMLIKKWNHPKATFDHREILWEFAVFPGNSPLSGNRNLLKATLLDGGLKGNIAILKEARDEAGYGEIRTRRELLRILMRAGLGASEECLSLAREQVKQSPADLAAVNALLADASERGDREAVVSLCCRAIRISPPALAELNHEALNILDDAGFSSMLDAFRNAQTVVPHEGREDLTGYCKFISQTAMRAPKLLDQALGVILAGIPQSQRDDFSGRLGAELNSLELDPALVSVASRKINKPGAENGRRADLPTADPFYWEIPRDVQGAWGWARQAGRGAEVGKLYEAMVAARFEAFKRVTFRGGERCAARHATDKTWAMVLQAERESHDPVKWIEDSAAYAVDCYYDGCPERAVQWMEAMESRITEPGHKAGGERFPEGIAAANGLAKAWYWIGRPERAEKLVRRFPELENQPEWQSFLKRNEETGDQIMIGGSLTRDGVAGESVLHWRLDRAVEGHSDSEDIWPPRKMPAGWEMRLIVEEEKQPFRMIEVHHKGISAGVVALGKVEPNASVRVEVTDRKRSRVWTKEIAAEYRNDGLSAGPTRIENLQEHILKMASSAGLKATVEQGSPDGPGKHIFLRGWLPAGGLEIRSWPAMPGEQIAMSAYESSVSEHVALVAETGPNGMSARQPETCACSFDGWNHGLGWNSSRSSGFHDILADDGQRLVLKIVSRDGSYPAFVATRLFCPQVVFRRNAPPQGAVACGCFTPGLVGKMAVAPGRKLAVLLDRSSARVQSRAFDSSQWPRRHRLGDHPAVDGGFCGDSFVVADAAGRLWKGSSHDFVFRSMGKLPSIAKAMLTASDAPVAAAYCDDGMVRVLDVSGTAIKVMSSVKLADGESFWLSPDGKTIVIKAPGEARKMEYRCLRATDGALVPDGKLSALFPEILVLGFCRSGEIKWEDRDGRPWSPIPDRQAGGVARFPESLSPLIRQANWIPTGDAKSIFVLDGQNNLLEVTVAGRLELREVGIGEPGKGRDNR
jgi:hypothetical protein